MAAVECAFPSPPLCFTLDIFARHTCWKRLRARAVSRAWRATLSNGLLWTDVDLSSGGRGEKASASFLEAVVRVANGHITRLDLSGQLSRDEEVAGVSRRDQLLAALHVFLVAHAGTLRHLVRGNECMSSEEARALFQRTPREVEQVEMGVECFHDEAKSLLCCEVPFEKLRLRSLHVNGREIDHNNEFTNESALSLALDMTSSACLEELTLNNAPLHVPLVREALSVACLKLTELSLLSCRLEPRTVPGLVLLLSHGCLTCLWADNQSYSDYEVGPLFDEPGGIAFGDALRANKTLKVLMLGSVQLWDELPAGLAVIDGVVGHATLKALQLDFNKVAVENRQMVGDVLGRLIAVPSALMNLTLSVCELSMLDFTHSFRLCLANQISRYCVFWATMRSAQVNLRPKCWKLSAKAHRSTV